jgi:hypothetical protein
VLTCVQCEKVWPPDRFNPDCASPNTCFKCRSSSVSLGFGGFRTQFHNHTIKEGQDRAMREARANGHDPVPAWHTSYTAGGIAGHDAKLKAALEKN